MRGDASFHGSNRTNAAQANEISHSYMIGFGYLCKTRHRYPISTQSHDLASTSSCREDFLFITIGAPESRHRHFRLSERDVGGSLKPLPPQRPLRTVVRPAYRIVSQRPV